MKNPIILLLLAVIICGSIVSYTFYNEARQEQAELRQQLEDQKKASIIAQSEVNKLGKKCIELAHNKVGSPEGFTVDLKKTNFQATSQQVVIKGNAGVVKDNQVEKNFGFSCQYNKVWQHNVQIEERNNKS